MIEFTYDEQGAKKYLVYKKDIGDKLDIVTLEMLLNNKIEGLVPFSYTQIDDSVELKYDISGMIPLEDYLEKVINKKTVLTILESIADGIIAADDYMLELSEYVFELAYTYIDLSSLKASMIVLPIAGEFVSAEEFLKNLIIKMKYNQSEDCAYVAALLNLVQNAKTFSAYELKVLLVKLKKNKEREKKSRDEILREAREHFNADNAKILIPCEEDEKKKNEVLKTEKEQKKEQKGQKKEKVKRGFFSKKGNRKEELSGIEIPGLDIQIPEISDNKKYEKDEQIKREIVLHTQKTGLEVHNVEKQDFGKTLYAYEDSEKTVYVPQQSNVEKNNFELYRNRTHETFEIVQKVSRVGRKRDVVEIYINGNRSIGRIHAILYIKEGNVYIEDNASKNGTYVDGVQIRVGMKPYLLKNKMKIRMGDEDFEFRQKNLERE